MKAGQIPYQSEPVLSDVAAIIIADRKPLDELPSFSDHDLGELAAVIAQRSHCAAHEPDLADPEAATDRYLVVGLDHSAGAHKVIGRSPPPDDLLWWSPPTGTPANAGGVGMLRAEEWSTSRLSQNAATQNDSFDAIARTASRSIGSRHDIFSVIKPCLPSQSSSPGRL